VTPDPRRQTPDAPQAGRCLAIGDIHGCFDALTTLAAFVPFEPEDCLITLGDYTSRGPDSRKVLDWLIARSGLAKADHNLPPEAENRQFAHAAQSAPDPGPSPGGLIALRGNHEIMMLQARDREDLRRDWLSYGGAATLASYSSRSSGEIRPLGPPPGATAESRPSGPATGEFRPGATGEGLGSPVSSTSDVPGAIAEGRPLGPANEAGGSPVSSKGDVPDAPVSSPGATGEGFGSPVSLMSRVPEAHWRFLEEELRGWYETPTHFFVHANYYPDIPLAEQPDLMLYWEKFDDPPPHESGKIMICGHTPQKSGLPRNIGHAVCIDTWVYGKGWLTCLDVSSGKYWQANQRRETRSGMLAGVI
jgi:Calcineurin-like phosphoesterase